MAKHAHLSLPNALSRFSSSRLAIGRLVDLSGTGHPIVQVEGMSSPIQVKTIFQIHRSDEQIAQIIGSDVLLHVLQEDPFQAVIAGVVSETIWSREFEESDAPHKEPICRNLVLAAQDQITLQVGESTIVMRKDGKIVVRGRDVSSRAARANKIKGATVDIN